jgi:serine/threonine protein kinase
VPYSSPEQFAGCKTFSSKADVFSMGIIFYEVLYSKCPFNIFTRTTHLDGAMEDYQQLWLLSPE